MIPVTKNRFDELMILNDEICDMNEEYAGIECAIQDGHTYEEYDTTEEECALKLAFVDLKRVELCNELKVPMNFLLDILDPCTVNRWEMYKWIKRVL